MATYHGEPVLIGVIGGSGVYALECLEHAEYVSIDTPFGKPSDAICIATVHGVRCAFLPRHGRAHVLNPSEVPYRANIFAMKVLGVQYLMTINAVGSLDAEYRPGDLVLVDQLFDKTIHRPSTFFSDGIVAHVPLAHPTSAPFREVAYGAMQEVFRGELAGDAPAAGGGAAPALPPFKLHRSGTLVTMEGPQFSTKAESLVNKAAGAHLIGMTSATEAKLAREAEMAFLIVAMVTDMDAWSDEPHVDVAMVLQTVQANGAKAQRYPPAIIRAIATAAFDDPEAFTAMQFGIMTKPEAISAEVRQRLAPLLKKYPPFP